MGVSRGARNLAGMVMTGLQAASILAFGSALAPSPAVAADLRIGHEAQITSVDPHHQNYGPNMGLAAHIFDRLVHQDDNQQLKPGLAVSWTTVSPTEWRFDLRPDVRFHDGSSFGAEDVVASWRRAGRMSGPTSMSVYTEGIKAMVADGPLTLRVVTNRPYPLLPVELSQLPIVPSEVENATSQDFADGTATIGTGPFRFLSWDAAVDRVELAANPSWWGGPVPWERVTMRSIPDDVARLTALISGDVDMIEGVPPADMARLKATKTVDVVSAPTVRVIYLGFDVRDGAPPDTTAADGGVLAGNPFQDPRVREAVSIAIDRPAIVREVLEGQGVSAGQLVPNYLFGASPRLGAIQADSGRARALLTEAGYPDGFRTRLFCTRDRYVNDVQICETVSRMLGGIGLDTAVSVRRSGAFFDRAAKERYPLRIAGWGTGTGEASYTLRGLLGTRDMDRGIGVSNFGGYGNPDLDARVAQAVATFDATRRAEILASAMDLAMVDRGVVPLHFQNALWGIRKTVAFTPTSDEFTLAIDAKPAETPR